MNKRVVRITSTIIALVLTFSVFTPGRATANLGTFMSEKTVNLAYFYKPPSNSDAATVSNNFNAVILSGKDETFRDELKAKGYGNTILQYFGAIGIQDPGGCTVAPRMNQVAYNVGDFCSISQSHPDWFLLDSNGQRILASPGSDTYRMDPGSSGWRNFFVTRVLDYQAKKGWSGLFLDNLEASLADIQKYGHTLAKYPNDASYQTALRGFLDYLKTNYAQPYNRPILANIIARRDEASWFGYMPYLDGAMEESWAVDWSLNLYLSEANWKNDLTLAEKTQNQGKHIILVSQGNEADTNRQKFAYASYLLVSNGKSAFRYAAELNYRQVWLYNNYQMDLGTPLGPRYQSGTSWRRDFTKGYVIVDPVNHSATISANPPSAPTATLIWPTATQIQPTTTAIQPTATSVVQPTKTPALPTSTPVILPSATSTAIVPTLVNTSIPASPTFTSVPATKSAETTFDEKDALFVYSSGWENKPTSKAYGGSYKETVLDGATVTFPFSGQSFSILYKGGVTFSKFDVYVDGTFVATVNQHMPAPSFQQRWDYPGKFTLGKHTLKLVLKVTSPSRYRGSLDAVIVR